MKRILLIATGGTIASLPREDGLAPALSGEELAAYVPQVSDLCQLDFVQPMNIDSTNMRPADWLTIARTIEDAYDDYDGFVILHGTDTMAYTASSLSYLIQDSPKPIVLTGSQQPMANPFTDAKLNLYQSVLFALDPAAHDVSVCFGGKVIAGTRARKQRTLSFNAFESINYPYIGQVNALGLHLTVPAPAPEAPFSLRAEYSDRIAVLTLFPGMSPEIFSYLKEKGYEGVYIEGFGLGGVPFLQGDFTGEIQRASGGGMPILVGSQCRYEGSNLNIYETGQRILDCGGIPVHDMTHEAVVTKLMWGLGQDKSRESILRLFQQNLVNEVSL